MTWLLTIVLGGFIACWLGVVIDAMGERGGPAYFVRVGPKLLWWVAIACGAAAAVSGLVGVAGGAEGVTANLYGFGVVFGILVAAAAAVLLARRPATQRGAQ